MGRPVRQFIILALPIVVREFSCGICYTVAIFVNLNLLQAVHGSVDEIGGSKDRTTGHMNTMVF